MPKEEFLIAMFNYLSLSKEDVTRALHMREKELIDYLNAQINSFNSENQHPDAKYFTYKDTTFVSYISPSSRTIGGRVLFRNITGRFAWEFSYIRALSQNSIEKGPKRFGEINQEALVLPSISLFKDTLEEQKTAKEILNSQRQIELKVEGEDCKDVFKQLFEYIKEHVSGFEEVRNNKVFINS